MLTCCVIFVPEAAHRLAGRWRSCSSISTPPAALHRYFYFFFSLLPLYFFPRGTQSDRYSHTQDKRGLIKASVKAPRKAHIWRRAAAPHRTAAHAWMSDPTTCSKSTSNQLSDCFPLTYSRLILGRHAVGAKFEKKFVISSICLSFFLLLSPHALWVNYSRGCKFNELFKCIYLFWKRDFG